MNLVPPTMTCELLMSVAIQREAPEVKTCISISSRDDIRPSASRMAGRASEFDPGGTKENSLSARRVYVLIFHASEGSGSYTNTHYNGAGRYAFWSRNSAV